MNSLPQELVDRICSYLSSEELKPTLTLNKAFNAATERLSGAFCSFELTKENSQKFIAIYRGRRLRLLRDVVFRTRFSPIPDAHDSSPTCRETSEELHEKDRLFSEQIKYFFTALKAVEQNSGVSNPGKVKITIYGPTREIGGQMTRTCLHRMYISWRIHLLAPATLPTLLSVQSLQLNQGEPMVGRHHYTEISKLDLRMIVDLAGRLPNLEFVGCQVGNGETCSKYIERSRFWAHYENDWEGPRRDSRHHFAEAAEAIVLPPSMERARFHFLGDYEQELKRQDQIEGMPDLVGSANRDPFSTALCTFTHNLRILELSGIVDPGLFQRHVDDRMPWPNLESLVIMFWPVTPSGAWYFQGPGGKGRQAASYNVTTNHYPPLGPDTNDVVHDEYLTEYGRSGDDIVGEAQFRIVPNEAALTPFLTAFATAASRMPKLKDANLWSPLTWYQYEELPDSWQKYEHLNGRPLAWGVAYDKPSEETSRKLTWRVSNWRPDEKLHALFRNIGREQHGDNVEEDWTDEQSGEDLVSREFFSDYEVMPRL